uniref:TAR DNA-binding protein 43 N-terminal domain-containing protein n=1 Tax=Plectus sambesii TaxID=2011161 RepID=A0A914VF99_9BILA
MNGESEAIVEQETDSSTTPPSIIKNDQMDENKVISLDTPDALENGSVGPQVEDDHQYNAVVDEAPAYIIVSDQEGGTPVELPLEHDHALLIKTLQIEYTAAMGIKYRNPETDIYRVIAPKEDGKLLPPPGGWGSHYFIACCPRAVDDRPWMGGEIAKPSVSTASSQLKRPFPSPTANSQSPKKRSNPPTEISDVNSTPVGSGQGPPSNGPGPVPGPSFDFCALCSVELNSQVQADAHYKGKKHLEKAAGGGRGRGGATAARGFGAPPQRGAPPHRGAPPQRGASSQRGAPQRGAPSMTRRGGHPYANPLQPPTGRGFPQRASSRGRGGGPMQRGGLNHMRGGGRGNSGELLYGSNGYESFGQTARQMFEKSQEFNDGTSMLDFNGGRGDRKMGGGFASNSRAPYGGH